MSPRSPRSPRSSQSLPSADDVARLSELIGEMMSHIHRRSAGDTLAIMNEAGLTMPQLVTLHALAHEGTRSVGAIASCLRLSPAATSHLVDRLVQAGYVARTEDPQDRRQRRLEITAPGRSLVERVQAERAAEFGAVLRRLSPDVRRQFADVLVRVIQEISSLPPSEQEREQANKKEPS